MAKGGNGPSRRQPCGKETRFKDCLGQFLDKERHPVRLGDDLLPHLAGQWPAGDVLGQGLDLGGCQAVERDAGDVRETGPGRLVFRPEGEER